MRGSVASRAAAGLLLACAGATSGCVGDGPLQPRSRAPDGVARVLNPACGGTGGTTHAGGTITTSERWDPSGNPHRVAGAITVDGGALRFLAGALVCFEPGTGVEAINGGQVASDGHDTLRVVLTASDPAQGWTGVGLNGTPASPSFMAHTLLEHVAQSSIAVRTDWDHMVVLDRIVIRQSGRAAFLLSPGSRILWSRIDTTTNASYPAVYLGDSTRFIRTTILRAAGVGLYAAGQRGMLLMGGRIEGSHGPGLVVNDYAVIANADPIRVVGGDSHPAELPVQALARIYPGLTGQDSLLGNARDTVHIMGGTLRARAYALPILPWRVRFAFFVDSGGDLRAHPGATLTFHQTASISIDGGGRVAARGAPGAPVLFTARDPAVGWEGIWLFGTPSSPSRLTNVRVEHVDDNHNALLALESHTVLVDSAVFRQVGRGIAVNTPGSRISRTRVDTTLASAGVLLAGNVTLESTLVRGAAGAGVEIWSSTVQVLSCEVRESGAAGILLHVSAPVHNCNLVGNAGPGIVNVYSTTAAAENNWWGDPAGPAGPGGDGAAGALSYTPWRTTPYVLPYVP